jgi:hypothetical protein
VGRRYHDRDEPMMDAGAAGGSPSVTRDHVRIHELGLLAGRVVDACAGRGAHPVSAVLDQLRGLVRRR